MPKVSLPLTAKSHMVALTQHSLTFAFALAAPLLVAQHHDMSINEKPVALLPGMGAWRHPMQGAQAMVSVGVRGRLGVFGGCDSKRCALRPLQR
jgi:hypothetical protein